MHTNLKGKHRRRYVPIVSQAETSRRATRFLVGKRQRVSKKGAFGLWHTTAERSEWHLPSLLFSSLSWLPPSLSLSLSLSAVTLLGVRTSATLLLYSLSHIIHTHTLSLSLTHTHTHTTTTNITHTHIPTSHSLDFPSLPFCLHRDPTPPPPTTNTHTHTHTHFCYRLQGCLVDTLTPDTLCLCFDLIFSSFLWLLYSSRRGLIFSCNRTPFTFFNILHFILFPNWLLYIHIIKVFLQAVTARLFQNAQKWKLFTVMSAVPIRDGHWLLLGCWILVKLTANCTPLIKHEHTSKYFPCVVFQFGFVSGCSRCLRVALCVAFRRPISELHLPRGQSHAAQRDPLLWCEWKEPRCCWLMLFLATSPFQRRLHCSGTAGGLLVCLSVRTPHPPKTSSRPSSSLTPPAAHANRPPRRSAVLQEVR